MKTNNFFIIFLVCFLMASSQAFADVRLSATPVDGSSSLHFQRFTSGIDIKKELRVRGISTAGKPYQVFQRLFEPIVNEKGESLDLDAVEISSVFGSNAHGTLYLQNADRLSYSDQLIYSSGQSGDSDTFVISYAIDPGRIKSGGNYFGKLVLTLRVMGEPSQEQIVINFIIESLPAWKFSVSGARSTERVTINESMTVEEKGGAVKISFSGNNGRQVRIFQEIDYLPKNSSSLELAQESLFFVARGGHPDSIKVASPEALRAERRLIYAGTASEDDIDVIFWMNSGKVFEQEAGAYVSTVKYEVQTDDGIETYTVNIECLIQPIFTINVNLPPEGVSFKDVIPTKPPEEKNVLVVVNSNLRQPYKVIQTMASPMTNEKGKEIAKEFLTMKVSIPDGQKGRTKYMEYESIEPGEFTIFSSDIHGASAQFVVTYKLQGYAQLSPGNFIAPVKFSLNQD